MRKNKAYLKYISLFPCCYCGDVLSVVHHIRSKKYIPNEFAGGTSLKPYDFCTIPLCVRCHDACHKFPKFEDDLDPSKRIIYYMGMYISGIGKGG